MMGYMALYVIHCLSPVYICFYNPEYGNEFIFNGVVGSLEKIIFISNLNSG